MKTITLADLEGRYDFTASKKQVHEVLKAALPDDFQRLRFFVRYSSWNGFFGSGVAARAGRIGRSRGLFMDPSEPLLPAADRSVLVASYFFDAARDEFDDRGTAHRDTHRCLSQATLLGMFQLTLAKSADATRAHPMHLSPQLAEPEWLEDLNDQVARGYGKGQGSTRGALFSAMGYHLGSEILADEEFTIIDDRMHEDQPELTRNLEALEVDIAGQMHGAFRWVSAHSGHGGAAEADHFDWAVEGFERALRYTPESERDDMVQIALRGFDRFCSDHERFFARVMED